MAKPGPAQDQTMDEILASIRQMISDSDSPAAKLKAAVPPRRPEPQPIAGNVSRLFVEPSDPKTEVKEAAPATDAGNVIDLVMAQAMEEARAEVEAEATAEFEEAKHAVEPVTASVPVAATIKPAPTAGRPDQSPAAPASQQAIAVQSGPPSTSRRSTSPGGEDNAASLSPGGCGGRRGIRPTGVDHAVAQWPDGR